MTPLQRAATGAALLATVVGLTGCGGDTPGGGSPTESTSASAGTELGTAEPTPSADPEAQLDGTIFLLAIGAPDGAVHYLHDGNLTLVHPNPTFAFFQSVTMSPNGKRIAYIDADGAGASGPLIVQTEYGGPPTTVGPSTLINTYLPQWAPDSNSVIVASGSGGVGRLDVPSGTFTPITSASGCCFDKFSPDQNYAVLRNGTTVSIAHADGSAPVSAIAPSGQLFNRIQSLSPDGHHVIALLRGPTDPMGDAGRSFGANAIVDAATGTSEPIPGGGTLKAGFYLANGNAVLRVTVGGVDKVVLASPAGAVLDEVTVPAAAADMALLGYAPPSPA